MSAGTTQERLFPWSFLLRALSIKGRLWGVGVEREWGSGAGGGGLTLLQVKQINEDKIDRRIDHTVLGTAGIRSGVT